LGNIFARECDLNEIHAVFVFMKITSGIECKEIKT
jgi:hypothetical protein